MQIQAYLGDLQVQFQITALKQIPQLSESDEFISPCIYELCVLY